MVGAVNCKLVAQKNYFIVTSGRLDSNSRGDLFAYERTIQFIFCKAILLWCSITLV